MNYSEFKERFVLINDKKFEIGYNEEMHKPFIKVGWCDCKVYFNILEEEKDIFYAIFEDCEIKKAMSEDREIDFDFKHNNNTCDWDCNFEETFKYEKREKKLIVFNKCDKCGEIINKNDDYNFCSDCGDVGCYVCYCGSWDDCDYCGASYCGDCSNLDYSEILNKSFCDDCEIEVREEEEEEQEQEQAGY